MGILGQTLVATVMLTWPKMCLQIELAEANQTEVKERLINDLRKLETEHEVHLRKQKAFYDRKREAKKKMAQTIPYMVKQWRTIPW